MLSNAYFVAKIRFDTAENEPAKNLQNFLRPATGVAARLQELRVEGLREREGQLGPGRAAEPRRKKRWLSVKIGRFGRIWVSGESNLEGSSDFSWSGGVPSRK